MSPARLLRGRDWAVPQANPYCTAIGIAVLLPPHRLSLSVA